ncbi:MAG: hypothetical protein NW216_14370 [Hyphomicrobium sp.]|nr:hypothetical protein [Hyphomicrobium sp.]
MEDVVATSPGRTRELDLLALYRRMLALRRFEEKAGLLFALGILGSPCPRGVGREAAYVGAAIAAARHSPAALVYATFRSPSLALACGVDLLTAFERLQAESPHGNTPDHTAGLVLYRDGHSAEPLQAIEGAMGLAGEATIIVIVERADVARLNSQSVLPANALIVVLEPSLGEGAGDLPHEIALLRPVNGSDVICVTSALDAAFDERLPMRAGIVRIALPEFRGHQATKDRKRDAEARASDPLTVGRLEVLESGRATPEGLAALDAAIKSELAAAAEALGATC